MFRPGQDVHGFTIEKRLGEGAFGAVYKAWDPKADRHVALKFFLEDEHKSKVFAEAKRLAKLTTQHTVDLYGVVDNPPCLVQQYVDGGTLEERISTSPRLTIDESLSIAAKVAKGLEALHGLAVTHCDLKPANILLATSGEVLLADFGVSIDFHSPESVNDKNGGTICYMSPERIKDPTKAKHPESDLYSLGVILYEMLCDVRPFVGEDPTQLEKRILSEAPIAPLGFNSDTPPALAALCLRALDKDSSRRPPSASDFYRRLRRIQFKRRHGTKLIICSVLLPLLLMAWILMNRDQKPDADLLALRRKADTSVQGLKQEDALLEAASAINDELLSADDYLNAGDYNTARNKLEEVVSEADIAKLDQDIEGTRAKIEEYLNLSGGAEEATSKFTELTKGLLTYGEPAPQTRDKKIEHLARLREYLEQVEAWAIARAKHAAFMTGFYANFCCQRHGFSSPAIGAKSSELKNYKMNDFEYDRSIEFSVPRVLTHMQALGVSAGCRVNLKQVVRPDYTSDADLKKAMFLEPQLEVTDKWPTEIEASMTLGWNLTVACTSKLYNNREPAIQFIREDGHFEDAGIPPDLRETFEKFLADSENSNASDIETVLARYVKLVSELTYKDFE